MRMVSVLVAMVSMVQVICVVVAIRLRSILDTGIDSKVPIVLLENEKKK